MIERHLRVKDLGGASGFLPNTPFILLILNGNLSLCATLSYDLPTFLVPLDINQANIGGRKACPQH
jgi:hypothetical protein